VAEDLTRDWGAPRVRCSDRDERFAALIGAGRTAILTSYAQSLEALHSPVVAEPGARDLAMTHGSQIIADLVASVRGDDHDRCTMPAATIEEAPPLSPADMVRAAAAFFDVTVNSLATYVKDDPDLLPCFITAVLALNEGISRRVGEAALAQIGYLLERVDRAHTEERRRIARDLHDRLGEGMSVALRHLELHEIANKQDPRTSAPRAAMAKEALGEAMRRLRLVTSDLRQVSVRNLERALVRYIDSAAGDAEVRLRVSGDEAWVSPAVIDEVFLIIMEAIRNALTHGCPQSVLIGIALAPHELRARVEDDGLGFIPAQAPDPDATGTGLVSMRERAALVGGRLTIASVPGQGTGVELLVPLPGYWDD
jgi:signal transduction histidine kinase